MKPIHTLFLLVACGAGVLAQSRLAAPAPASSNAVTRYEEQLRQIVDRVYAQSDRELQVVNPMNESVVLAQAEPAAEPATPPAPGAPTSTPPRIVSPRPLPVPVGASPTNQALVPPRSAMPATPGAPPAFPPPVTAIPPAGGGKTPTPPSRPAPTPLPPGGAPAVGAPALTIPRAPGVAPTPPAPGMPAVPGGTPATAGAANVAGGAEAAPPAEQKLQPGEIKFEDADLGQVLTIYQELTGRTVLRPASLPQATVSIITQTELSRAEAIQALDSILSLNGITMVPQGDKFVKALATAEAPQAGQIFYDADPEDLPEAGQYISYIAKLKYTDPTEIVQALQPFASKAPNSIMAIKSTQTLVLRDNAENVKRMLEMIREIDVYIPREYKPVVIPIKYAMAADIAQVLSSLTAGGGAVTSVGGGGVQSQRFSTPGGGGMPGYTPGGGTSGYGSTASRYSSGYGGSTGGSYGGVRPYAISTTPAGPDGSPMVETVTPQSSFQQRLQQIVSKASEDDIIVLGQTKIIADERTNSLLIFASEEDIEMIQDIVSKLDVVLAQVLIEAVVLEVSLSDTFSFGLSALQKPSTSGKWAGVGGFNNGQSSQSPWSWLPGGGGSSGTNSAALIPSLDSGFSYFAKYRSDLDLAIQAIAGVGHVKVLSRPRVQTSHAVPCRIFVGETRPYVTGYGYGYGGYNQSQVAQLRIGIELNVLPLINVDGLVVMDIDQRVDNVGEMVIIDGNEVPSTVERSANAKVSVRDGETVILGGFMRTEKRDSNSGVPFLKDIPLLGYLFRSTSKSGQRVELMILIRPMVLPTPEDAALVAMEEKAKMPGISKAERTFTEDERKAEEKARELLYKREGF